MKKLIKSLELSLLLFFMATSEAYAICPVCTIAVGAGLGLSRFLGVDDAVSGVWVGGLLLSSSLWLDNWLGKKNIKLKYQKYIVVGLMYGITIIPLWVGGIIGHPYNEILGIDKLIFGTGVGTAAFLLGVKLDKKVREIRGKQLFDFQKVAFPVGGLVISSIVMFIVTSVKISL